MHRLVDKLGLAQVIDERIKLLKVHLPYHESDHVLNLAYSVLCGGRRLGDIQRLRHDSAYMNTLGAQLIPDPPTAGDFCRRFDESQITELMECINSVRRRGGFPLRYGCPSDVGDPGGRAGRKRLAMLTA